MGSRSNGREGTTAEVGVDVVVGKTTELRQT